LKYKEVILSTKGQITVPKKIREILGVDYGESIAFYIDDDLNIKISSPNNMNINAKDKKKTVKIIKEEKQNG